MYHMFLNDECSETLRLYVVKRPDVPSPQKRYNEKGLPGRDGKLYEDTGYYEDITISVELNYMTSPDNWNNVWRNAGCLHPLEKDYLSAMTDLYTTG